VSDIHVIGWPYSWPHETNGCVVFRAGTEFSESNDRGWPLYKVAYISTVG